MTPPRVLLVCPRFWPIVGPRERALAYWTDGLAARGWPVTVLSARWNPKWPTQTSYRGVGVVRIEPAPRGGWSTFRYIRALRRWLRRYGGRFDVACVSSLGIEAQAAVTAVADAMPVVLCVESTGATGEIARLRGTRRGRRRFGGLARAAAIVALGETAAREWIAAGGSESLLHRIDDGVPVSSPRDESSRVTARASLGEGCPALRLHPFEPMLVCDAELFAPAVVRDVMAAFCFVLTRWPLARLWLVGDLADREGFEAEIQALGSSGRVQLPGAFDQPSDLLAAADAAVVPMVDPEPSLALREAMAAGAAIVGWDLRPAGPPAAEGLPLLRVASGDRDALGVAMDRLVDDIAMATDLGRLAREYAQRRWALDAAVQQYQALFDRVASRTER